MSRISLIYPGSLWFKRIMHFCIIYSIGFNFFLGHIQNRIITEIDHYTVRLKQKNDVINANTSNNIERIQKKSFWGHFLNGMSYIFGTPSSQTINIAIDGSNYAHKTSEIIKEELHAVKQLLHHILTIIRITSYFIWLPIIWSCTWLYFDYKKSTVKRTISILLLTAIPFNIIVYTTLMTYTI